MKYQPIVDIHASWLALNPLQGCPNGCNYCFLSKYDLNNIYPIELCKPSAAIDMLLNYKYYDDNAIVAFFTLTDIFLDEKTISYLVEVLKIIKERDLNNTLVFITKQLIPDKVIEIFSSMHQNIIVYLSYSGLGTQYERGIKHENILKNFSKLYKSNIKVIHYWRPLIPDNTDENQIRDTLNYVSQYAIASSIAGLKLTGKNLLKLDFWPELKELDMNNIINSEGVIPRNALEAIRNYSTTINYPTYLTNACALSIALNVPCVDGFYNDEYCKEQNNCPNSQRQICKDFFNTQTLDEKLIECLFSKLSLEYNGYVFDEATNSIDFLKTNLSYRDVFYLSKKLHKKIKNTKNNENYWGTSLLEQKLIEV